MEQTQGHGNDAVHIVGGVDDTNKRLLLVRERDSDQVADLIMNIQTVDEGIGIQVGIQLEKITLHQLGIAVAEVAASTRITTLGETLDTGVLYDIQRGVNARVRLASFFPFHWVGF